MLSQPAGDAHGTPAGTGNHDHGIEAAVHLFEYFPPGGTPMRLDGCRRVILIQVNGVRPFRLQRLESFEASQMVAAGLIPFIYLHQLSTQ